MPGKRVIFPWPYCRSRSKACKLTETTWIAKHLIDAVTINPRKPYIAWGDKDGLVTVWGYEKKASRYGPSVAGAAPTGWSYGWPFIGENLFTSAGQDNRIILWDTETLAARKTEVLGAGQLRSIKARVNNLPNLLVAGGTDQRVRLFEVKLQRP